MFDNVETCNRKTNLFGAFSEHFSRLYLPYFALQRCPLYFNLYYNLNRRRNPSYVAIPQTTVFALREGRETPTADFDGFVANSTAIHGQAKFVAKSTAAGGMFPSPIKQSAASGPEARLQEIMRVIQIAVNEIEHTSLYIVSQSRKSSRREAPRMLSVYGPMLQSENADTAPLPNGAATSTTLPTDPDPAAIIVDYLQAAATCLLRAFNGQFKTHRQGDLAVEESPVLPCKSLLSKEKRVLSLQKKCQSQRGGGGGGGSAGSEHKEKAKQCLAELKEHFAQLLNKTSHPYGIIAAQFAHVFRTERVRADITCVDTAFLRAQLVAVHNFVLVAVHNFVLVAVHNFVVCHYAFVELSYPRLLECQLARALCLSAVRRSVSVRVYRPLFSLYRAIHAQEDRMVEEQMRELRELSIEQLGARAPFTFPFPGEALAVATSAHAKPLENGYNGYQKNISLVRKLHFATLLDAELLGPEETAKDTQGRKEREQGEEEEGEIQEGLVTDAEEGVEAEGREGHEVEGEEGEEGCTSEARSKEEEEEGGGGAAGGLEEAVETEARHHHHHHHHHDEQGQQEGAERASDKLPAQVAPVEGVPGNLARVHGTVRILPALSGKIRKDRPDRTAGARTTRRPGQQQRDISQNFPQSEEENEEDDSSSDSDSTPAQPSAASASPFGPNFAFDFAPPAAGDITPLVAECSPPLATDFMTPAVASPAAPLHHLSNGKSTLTSQQLGKEKEKLATDPSSPHVHVASLLHGASSSPSISTKAAIAFSAASPTGPRVSLAANLLDKAAKDKAHPSQPALSPRASASNTHIKSSSAGNPSQISPTVQSASAATTFPNSATAEAAHEVRTSKTTQRTGTATRTSGRNRTAKAKASTKTKTKTKTKTPSPPSKCRRIRSEGQSTVNPSKLAAKSEVNPSKFVAKSRAKAGAGEEPTQWVAGEGEEEEEEAGVDHVVEGVDLGGTSSSPHASHSNLPRPDSPSSCSVMALPPALSDSLPRSHAFTGAGARKYAESCELLGSMAHVEGVEQQLDRLAQATSHILTELEQHMHRHGLPVPEGGVSMAADDLLPVFQYCLIHSGLTHLVSRIAMLTDLIPTQERTGQKGYSLATLESAVMDVRGNGPLTRLLHEQETQEETQVQTSDPPVSAVPSGPFGWAYEGRPVSRETATTAAAAAAAAARRSSVGGQQEEGRTHSFITRSMSYSLLGASPLADLSGDKSTPGSWVPTSSSYVSSSSSSTGGAAATSIWASMPPSPPPHSLQSAGSSALSLCNLTNNSPTPPSFARSSSSSLSLEHEPPDLNSDGVQAAAAASTDPLPSPMPAAKAIMTSKSDRKSESDSPPAGSNGGAESNGGAAAEEVRPGRRGAGAGADRTKTTAATTRRLFPPLGGGKMSASGSSLNTSPTSTRAFTALPCSLFLEPCDLLSDHPSSRNARVVKEIFAVSIPSFLKTTLNNADVAAAFTASLTKLDGGQVLPFDRKMRTEDMKTPDTAKRGTKGGDGDDGRVWSIPHRFSDFVELQKELRQAKLGRTAVLPILPRRTVMRRVSARFLEERRQALEKFLHNLLGMRGVPLLPQVRTFLALDQVEG
eukprot:g9720.t1